MSSLQGIFKKLSRNKHMVVSSYCMNDKIIIKVQESFTYKDRVSVTLDLNKTMDEQEESIKPLKQFYA